MPSPSEGSLPVEKILEMAAASGTNAAMSVIREHGLDDRHMIVCIACHMTDLANQPMSIRSEGMNVALPGVLIQAYKSIAKMR